MLRTSLLKLASRPSLGLRTAVGMPRSISILRSGRWQRRLMTEQFTKRTPTVMAHGSSSSKLRLYTTSAPKDDPTPPEDSQLLEAFEKMSHNPSIWLPLPSPTDRAKVAYLYLLQMIMYLGRPQPSDEAAAQFLSAFDSAPAPPSSEIGRARTCSSICTSVVVHTLLSIPETDPLRVAHPKVFDTLGALAPLRDRFLADRVWEGGKGWEVAVEEVQEWSEFWGRAMPVVMDLAMRLDEAGFGIGDERLGEGGDAS